MRTQASCVDQLRVIVSSCSYKTEMQTSCILALALLAGDRKPEPSPPISMASRQGAEQFSSKLQGWQRAILERDASILDQTPPPIARESSNNNPL